jgi:multidrug efflux pump subunit AcrB
MSLTAIAIEKRTVTYFVVFLLVVGGIGAFFSLGQLEDPEFTVKTGVITTVYPGASPEEVELEVTDRIELAIQEMPQVKYIESSSREGISLISVELKAQYWSDQLPQVWDELRRKIRNIEHMLPPGAGRPDVTDDFGDVFGFQLAVVGDGFSYAELEEYAKEIKREISLVKDVARVDLWGVQNKAIYVNVSQSQLAELGLSDASVKATLEQQNMVVDAGGVDLQRKRFRIAPTGEFKSPEDIANLHIRASFGDELSNLTGAADKPVSSERAAELIRIISVVRLEETGLSVAPARLESSSPREARMCRLPISSGDLNSPVGAMRNRFLCKSTPPASTTMFCCSRVVRTLASLRPSSASWDWETFT